MTAIKNNTPIKIAVLGSTGSVGIQSLDAARFLGLEVVGISAHFGADKLASQAREYGCGYCTLADADAALKLRSALAGTGKRIYSGADGIIELINECGADIFVNAVSGAAGLMPSIEIIKLGRRLALANKETLVVGGDIVMPLAAETGAEIIPVDSELCAIHQCLRGGDRAEVSRVLLTASGGPFFGYDADRLREVTLADALAHPNWKMGAKITIDSATLLNKGFEMIETVKLFGIDPAQVEVIVQRESIIHSMVEYIDNSIIAQMGTPDMRACVQYALSAPARMPGISEKLDLCRVGTLSFYKPDFDVFPLLGAAYEAVKTGGAMPAVLNGASEAAVNLFLKEKIPFYRIADVISGVIAKMDFAGNVSGLEGILACDAEARERVRGSIQ